MKELDISVVSPVYDEEENIPIIYDKLKNVLNKLNKSYEIIFIDDGSTDNSFKILEKLYNKNKNIKIIKLRTNFGQTSALNIGFKNAKGSVIVTIDSDLQNDPKDIPKMLNKLKEGYDAVSGWRLKEKNKFQRYFFPKYQIF